ncbi:hypothetical protein PanWU01x14_266250 [Parasponia andersonii]|uniref:Uncharacterized protein n=1 Tax=Parasponia andersonii TaxID=3476 RepID=A0A2P5B6V7_PARAD|nr:hypothetical protein PanWU01x14_266250 [Parasponia andersonii]
MTLNEEILIDEDRAAEAKDKGLLDISVSVGHLVRSKDRRRLLQSYETQKRDATEDLAHVKELWFQTYGLPNEWKRWDHK